jgi:oligosaccharide reducing-end xylanase
LDQHFWLDAAQESRAFFNCMMHPITGLNQDYSEFSGVAKGDAWKDTCMHDDFCYDTWCTAVNWAVNYAWWKC